MIDKILLRKEVTTIAGRRGRASVCDSDSVHFALRSLSVPGTGNAFVNDNP